MSWSHFLAGQGSNSFPQHILVHSMLPLQKENEDLSVVVCTDYATGLYTLTGDDDDPVDEDLVGVESTDAIEDALLVKAFVKADD